MRLIQHIDILPKPLKFLAQAFLDSDPHSPVIADMTLDELEKLSTEEEIVFQLIFDRVYQNWYLVAVGDYDRKVASDYIIAEKTRIKRSLLAFAPVDEAWIRSKRHEYETSGKMMYPGQYQEFDPDQEQWVQQESPRIMVGYGD